MQLLRNLVAKTQGEPVKTKRMNVPLRTVTLVTNFQKPAKNWEINSLKLNTSKEKLFITLRYKNKIMQSCVYISKIGDRQEVMQDAILKCELTFQDIIASILSKVTTSSICAAASLYWSFFAIVPCPRVQPTQLLFLGLECPTHSLSFLT